MEFARPLATGVFKSLCIFFHMPYSFFLGSSFFLPSPSFFWRVRVLGAAPWGPRLLKVHHPSPSLCPQGSPLAASWPNFSTFWTSREVPKNHDGLASLQKAKNQQNQWPKVASGIILGPLFDDFGSHFNIDLSTFRTIDSASIFHWFVIDFRNSSNL